MARIVGEQPQTSLSFVLDRRAGDCGHNFLGSGVVGIDGGKKCFSLEETDLCNDDVAEMTRHCFASCSTLIIVDGVCSGVATDSLALERNVYELCHE